MSIQCPEYWPQFFIVTIFDKQTPAWHWLVQTGYWLNLIEIIMMDCHGHFPKTNFETFDINLNILLEEIDTWLNNNDPKKEMMEKMEKGN